MPIMINKRLIRLFGLDLRQNTNTHGMKNNRNLPITLAKPMADKPSDYFQNTAALPEVVARS